MAIRGGKKLPDKRGFVDGPGGYKGKDDRDRGFGGSSSGSGSSSGGSSSGGSGSGNFNNTPALKTNYTMADVKKNKIDKQLQKAESAASQHKGITGTAYLDQYNTLKAKKDKTKNQLSNLAAMNEQMGYNPTQGMGIMGSLNYNTIGAGDDIANLMNNPLVKMAGMATNPALFTGGQFLKNAYGAYSDENDDTGLFSALGNTAQDVTPFDTSKVKDFLGNIFRQEEEDNRFGGNLTLGSDYVGSDVINTIEPTKTIETSPFMEGYLEDMKAESPYGGTPSNANLLDSFSSLKDYLNSFKEEEDNRFGGNLALGNLANQDLSNQTPGFFDNVKTDYNNTKDFFGNLFSGLDIQPNDLEAERMANRGPGNGPLLPLPGDFVDLPQPPGGPGGPGASPPPIGFGSINPGADYNRLYGGFNQGGRVPPMSGPMSNGLGNLFKMK